MFKYFLIYVTFIVAIHIVSVFGEDFALKTEKSVHQQPYYRYFVSDVNNDEQLDHDDDVDSVKKQLNLNVKNYHSFILYIHKRPPSLSDEKYAEKIVNLQNTLELPAIFRSEKSEIIQFLKEDNNVIASRKKRQYATGTEYQTNGDYENGNVTITVTIYSKENDIIIIKEIVPEQLTSRVAIRPIFENSRRPLSPNVPNYDWYPTLRTIPVYKAPNWNAQDYNRYTTTSTSTPSYSRSWDDYSTESTTSTSGGRPSWGWFFPKFENNTTSTTTYQPYVPSTTTEEITNTTTSRPFVWGWGWSDQTTTTTEPNTTTPYQPYIPMTTTEEITTTTTYRPFVWGWSNQATTTTTPSTTTTSRPNWGWLFPINPTTTTSTTTDASTWWSSETTTSTYNNYWDSMATTSTPVDHYWDTTTPRTTTETSDYTNYWDSMTTTSTSTPAPTTTNSAYNNYWYSMTTTSTPVDHYWDTTTPRTTTETADTTKTTTSSFGLFNWFG